MKFFYIQILIYIHFSFEQNEDDKTASNITELLNKKLINLKSQIINMINNKLNSQEQLFEKADSKQKIIKSMLTEINYLKKRYKRNMIFSYR